MRFKRKRKSVKNNYYFIKQKKRLIVIMGNFIGVEVIQIIYDSILKKKNEICGICYHNRIYRKR